MSNVEFHHVGTLWGMRCLGNLRSLRVEHQAGRRM